MNRQKVINILKNTAAVIVIMALFLIIVYQNRNRVFESNRTDDTETVSPNGKNSGVFREYIGGDIGTMGDKVAIITTTVFSVLNSSGKGVNTTVTLSKPVLHTKDNHVIYYGKNEKEAMVYTNDKPRYMINTENKIIRAKAAYDGYSLIITEKEGYNCEIMVYNASGDAIFKWDISESELLDADFDPSNSRIIISQLGTEKGKMQGQLVLIDTAKAKILSKEGYDAEVFYNIGFNRNGMYTALGSNRVIYFNKNGSEKWSYDYQGRTLLKADIENPDMMVLAFSSAGSGIKGNTTEIETLDRLGKIKNSIAISGIIDDVAANEQRIAAAFGKNIYLFNSKLKEVKTLEAETGVKEVAFFGEDESIFVLEESGGIIMK